MDKIKLKDDYLDRGNYARSLYRIIGDYIYDPNNPQITKPIANNDNKAFVVAVSSAWGTGKTYFMNLFEGVLRQDKSSVIEGSQLFDETLSFKNENVITYDAWKNDFWNNAFEPLFDTLIHSELLTKTIDEDTKAAVKSLEAVSNSLIAVFETLGTVNTTSKVIAKLLSSLKSSGNELSGIFDNDEVIRFFPEYSTYRKSVEKLKNALEETVRHTGKIAIIIDELDRCKPTFAVQTLEIVKHLFNVPGIVFIFSLDLNQLQHCIKTVYGNEFDAVGYLERFFDYTSLLPRGDERNLFEKTANEFAIRDVSVNKDKYYEICKVFSLSIREIRTVLSSFFYLERFELEGYPPIAKQLYFYLLALKYKEPVKINNALSTSEDGMFLRKQLLTSYPPVFISGNKTTNPFYDVFSENPIIDLYDQYSLVNISDGSFTDSETFSIVKTPLKIKSNGLNSLRTLENASLSYVIYAKDMDNIELFNLRLLEYLLRKVELYDSPI